MLLKYNSASFTGCRFSNGSSVTFGLSVKLREHLKVTHALMDSARANKDAFSELWNIPLDEFSEIVEAGDIPIIDVREIDEVQKVRIAAKRFYNISLQDFEDALKMDDNTFQSTYKFSKPKPEDQIALICRSGRRSRIAIQVARANNYKNIRHYNEGTNGWIQAFPDQVVTSTSK